MRVTLGQVRKLLCEAQEGPDEELGELADELLQNLKDTFTPLEVMDARWTSFKGGQHFRFSVTIGDEISGYGNTKLLNSVIEAVRATMTMMTGDPNVNEPNTTGVTISAGDFVAVVYEDWDNDWSGGEEVEFHWVFVSLQHK